MSPAPHAFLLWDIDGTLLSTGRAGVFALEDAAREILGCEPAIADLPTAGLTDAQVAAMVIEACGGDAETSTVDAFLRAYERELPGRLPLRRGTVMPNVEAILDDLGGDPAVTSLLLTGNTRAGAAAKLAHYGLARHFGPGGAFCVGGGPREDIARAAWELAAAAGGEPDPDRVFVIGDTPHDVRCGKAIGARTVAVATGGASAEVLRACTPWRALDVLPPPAEFRAMIAA